MLKSTQILEIINDTGCNVFEVGALLARSHRYLQAVFFKICRHFLIVMAHNYQKGYYDERNEDECEKAFHMVNGLEGFTADELYELNRDKYEAPY